VRVDGHQVREAVDERGRDDAGDHAVAELLGAKQARLELVRSDGHADELVSVSYGFRNYSDSSSEVRCR
jgi:hypothetical protein